LDFGATRGFPQEFIDDYLAVLKAAANLDREACRVISLRLGYLTGRETEVILVSKLTNKRLC
jgi:aarF domain-containing kinase